MSRKSYSGKFVLRIDPKLHRELYDESLAQQKSLNQLCVDRLSARADTHPLLTALRRFLDERLIAVYQYGSTVRGEATTKSDIDILCVIDDSQLIQRELYDLWDKLMLRERLNPKYSVHFVHPLSDLYNASSLWLEVALAGIPLYDPSSRIQRALIQLRQLTINGWYQRKVVHGQPVWSRKREPRNA